MRSVAAAAMGVSLALSEQAPQLGCTGRANPTAGVCYQGATLGETVKIELKTFAERGNCRPDDICGKGKLSLTGKGLKAFTCSDHDFTKSGQDVTTDLGDCLPSGVTVESVKYCSDADQVVVKVKDTLTLTVTAKKVACGTDLWKQYKEDYGISFNDQNEDDWRYVVFKANLDTIEDTNEKSLGYELGINQFAHMTSEEFGAHYTGFKKPENVWGELPYLGRHNYTGAALPDSVDWSAKGAVTPIKNQGQCGSCWSFSTTGSLEGANQISTGKLVSLSEQQFVDCDKVDQACNGGLMDNAFKYAKQNALCTEESYPYKGTAGTCAASSCTVGIAKGGVTGYTDVNKDDMNAMMEAVAQQPVSIAIEANLPTFQMYKKGVLSGICGASLDHGVLAVGYGELDGKKYWKVKNSWGSTWGMDGYILLLRGKSAAGECGLLSGPPSYPQVSKAAETVVV